MQEIELCKSIRIATCPLNKPRMFTFAQTQVCMPLYLFFINFSRHRNYKRIKDRKRRKKTNEMRQKIITSHVSRTNISLNRSKMLYKSCKFGKGNLKEEKYLCLVYTNPARNLTGFNARFIN